MQDQIHNPTQDDTSEAVELGELLLEVYESHKNSSPNPSLETLESSVLIQAEKEQLKSAIGHIVQNALDATPKNGEVSIATKQALGNIYVFIQDSGCGMSEDFINNSLFKPFESTKGLTGMGIGVYETREYIVSQGGEITVESKVGVGTVFRVKYPLVNELVG